MDELFIACFLCFLGLTSLKTFSCIVLFFLGGGINLRLPWNQQQISGKNIPFGTCDKRKTFPTYIISGVVDVFWVVTIKL